MQLTLPFDASDVNLVGLFSAWTLGVEEFMSYSQADIQGKLLGASGFWASVQFAW